MLAVSSSNILPRLQHLLNEETRLNDRLQKTHTAGDGLFNEITSGRLSITEEAPNEARLTEMRTAWIPEVKERLKNFLQHAGSYFETDRLHAREIEFFRNTISLNKEEIDNLGVYDPTLAHTIIKTDECARNLIQQIEALHLENGKLVEAIQHRQTTFTTSLNLDKWNFSIESCRGVNPSLYKWHTSTVKSGAFMEEIQKGLSISPMTEGEVTDLEEVTLPPQEETSKPFSQHYRDLLDAFNTLLQSSKKGKQDLANSLTKRIETVQGNVMRIKELAEHPLPAALRSHFQSEVLSMQSGLKEQLFREVVASVTHVKELFEARLPGLTPLKSVSSETLNRIRYLDPTFEGQISEIKSVWERELAELQSAYHWISFANLSALGTLEGELRELSAKLKI
ncbi:MAG: hypothetical protein KBC64_00060 [Simkaniaceae bacterium]|nr:hypothetical protein [Simkaniaceae bacterium]